MWELQVLELALEPEPGLVWLLAQVLPQHPVH